MAVTCNSCGQTDVQPRAIPVVPGGQLATMLGRVARLPFGFGLKQTVLMQGLVCPNCGAGEAHGKVLQHVVTLRRSRDLDEGYVDGRLVYRRARPRHTAVPR